MIRNTIAALALAVVLVAGLATAGILYAQRSGGMGGMMGMMPMMENCPMMSAMQQSPRAALEHREELGLSEEQVRRLEVLDGVAQQARTRAVEQMQALHSEVAEVTSRDSFDEAAVRAAFERMSGLHTEMGVAMLRTRHQVREVLSAEQREELAELGGGMMGMRGMMGNMHGMGMENCPMMRGSMMEGMRMQGSDMHRQDHPQS